MDATDISSKRQTLEVHSRTERESRRERTIEKKKETRHTVRDLRDTFTFETKRKRKRERERAKIEACLAKCQRVYDSI